MTSGQEQNLFEILNERIKNSEPSFVVKAIQPTFTWETVVGYLTHCADKEFGDPVAILTYRLPAAEQLDSIKVVKEFLSEYIDNEILGCDLYTSFTSKNDQKYTSKNDILVWNVLGESKLTYEGNEREFFQGDLIYVPKNTEYKIKPETANAFVVISLK